MQRQTGGRGFFDHMHKKKELNVKSDEREEKIETKTHNPKTGTFEIAVIFRYFRNVSVFFNAYSVGILWKQIFAYSPFMLADYSPDPCKCSLT